MTQLGDGVRIYAVATTTGDLCALAERLPNNNGNNDAAATGCGSPLTQTEPTTIASFQANESTPTISYGITLDNVAAVSFLAAGQEVTVRVKDNVWAYEATIRRSAPSLSNSMTAAQRPFASRHSRLAQCRLSLEPSQPKPANRLRSSRASTTRVFSSPPLAVNRLALERMPAALGDDLRPPPVRDRGLVVHRVPDRAPDLAPTPPRFPSCFPSGFGAEVREDPEVDDAQRLRPRRPPAATAELLPTPAPCHAAGARRPRPPSSDGSSAASPDSRIQWGGTAVAAVDQQDVGLLHPGHPAIAREARQRGELQHAERASTGAASSRRPATNPTRGRARKRVAYAAVGMQSASHSSIGFPGAVQRGADARVPDAAGREEELHAKRFQWPVPETTSTSPSTQTIAVSSSIA